MNFEHSEFLYLFILTSALGLILISLAILRRRSLPKRTGVTSLILRVLCLLSLIAGLLGPYLEEISQKASATLLLDISESMNEETASLLLAQVKNYQAAGIETKILPFSESTAPLSSLVPNPDFKKIRTAWSKLNIGQTNLEGSLDSINQTNLILISDGFETKGDSNLVITSLKDKAVKVYPLTPESNTAQEGSLSISKLYAPLIAPAEKSVDIRTTIENKTTADQSGMLEVMHGDKLLYKKIVNIPANSEKLIITQSNPSEDGIAEVEAKFTPVDPKLSSTSLTTYISGAERDKILLISGNDSDQRLLKQLLAGQKYKLETLSNPSSSSIIKNLNDYAIVILNNTAKSQLPTSLPKRVNEYVKQGGSFIMIGGNRSFGLGDYKDTPIEEALPVEMVPPQTTKKRLNVAVSLVMDKSRSMANNDKIIYAKEAAAAVINSLKNEDYIQVIGFDSSPFIVVKMEQLATNRSSALERVTRLFPAGRTNLLPALHEARRSFAKVNAGRKHLIVLTDGKIPTAGAYYSELIAQLRSGGVTVSTVMLGSETDTQELRDMATQGGGAFYQTTDARSLPKIFLDDIKVSTGERTLKEQSEYTVRRGPDGILSTSITAFPPLRGYVQAKRKPKSDLELVVYNNDKAEPLLVSWSYGKGKSIAFTSDANGRWSSYWASWPKFTNFWVDIIDSLVPQNKEQTENINFDLKRTVEKGNLKLDLAVYNENVSGAISAELRKPDGSVISVNFEQVAKGRYKASIADAIAGRYDLEAKIGNSKLNPVAFHLSGDLFGEKKGQGYNIPQLEKLASETGGMLNPPAAELLKEANRSITKTDLSSIFYILATILFLLEILKRELGLRLYKRAAIPS